jgi:hypothetical protein
MSTRNPADFWEYFGSIYYGIFYRVNGPLVSINTQHSFLATLAALFVISPCFCQRRQATQPEAGWDAAD